MAQVKVVVGADKTFADQLMGVVAVALLFVNRHQPPQRKTAAQANRGAVELVQQQIVLGAAAVLDAQFVITLALGKAGRVDQVKVDFAVLAGGPVADQLAFAAQLFNLSAIEFGCVADPDIQIALLGLADGAAAAHQIQAVDLAAEAGGVAAILKAAGQALSDLQATAVRLKAVQAARGLA